MPQDPAVRARQARAGAASCAQLLAWLLVLAATLAQAQPADYALDPVHSRVVFTVDHIGLSKAIGTFAQPEGRLRFDAADWSSAEVDVRLDLRTLDLGEADWNRRMLRRDFFHAGRHPEARFVSQRIEPIDAERFLVHGELSLRGQAHPATMRVHFNGERRHPMTFRPTAGFSATLSLSRSALGMVAYPNVIGDAVEVAIEVEARRLRTGETAPPPAALPAEPDLDPETDAEPEDADAVAQ